MSTSSPTKTSAPTATAVPSGLTSYSGGCSEAAPGAPPTSLPANPREARLELRIPSMDCPNEERQIRAALERIAGVRAMKFDLGQRRLAVDAPEATWPHVIAAINQLGFETYPPTGPSASAVAQVDACATTDSCCSSACAAPVALATDAAQENAAEFQGLLLRVPAMDCPTEEAQIRRALEGLEAVRRLQFDLPARTLSVDAPASAKEAVMQALLANGFKSEVLSEPPSAELTARAQRVELLRLVGALAVAALAEALHFFASDALGWKAVGMGIAAAAIALSGLSVFKKGFSSLLRGQLNINALMSVAVIGAFLIGQWPEAAMVMALYSLAELIEARSVDRARNAIAGLLSLSPTQAEVQQSDGAWAIQQANVVKVGALVRVKPGERFALDGRVTSGHGAVDQSPVTGESVPVDKGPDDDVFAGTINQSGSLEFRVTHPATDTVLARIIHAVEQAQGQRAPTQRFVDKFAAIYTPSVFVMALAIALGTPMLLGWDWLTALYKALVLLVIACPCALVISTPVTVVSGLAAAARRGILIKGGVYLEQARKLAVLGLDKTGTLTEGRPKLVASEIIANVVERDAVLRMAKSLAARSDHPVSKAVVEGLPGESLDVMAFGAELGKGVRGTIDGMDYVLGNHRWIHERGQCSAELEAMLLKHESQGRTLSVLASETQVLALFAVADTTKDTSRQAIAELKAMGVRTVMLTGDNEATAKAIGHEVGVEEVCANLLPQDKQAWVTETAAANDVGMVGDGVNDSPSLAAASVGFSMGAAGTDTAKEAADVLIMNDDLRKVAETIRLSKRTYSVLWQNITLALGIKAVFFVLAVFGSASMWMAVFADMGASLLVVFNGLRLLKPPRA
ncbi:heavy metal translocating P-type ATPase [Mitsuaria sp. GD03876]|nr:heavy metal translocating P-type ATPase [Mitsuaria sp. GD03876]MDH0863673.1 heavy metal translocating P-type ATPase [Mitsuaria sp. GD03876]